MRSPFGVIYWVVVGVLTIVGVYTSVLGNLPPYFLLVALVMIVVGAWRSGFRYSWAALIGFGFLPALLLSNILLGWIAAADWSCSRVEFGASGSQYGGCSIIAGELIVTTAIFWAVTLFGVGALLYLLPLARPRTDSQEARSGMVFGAVGLGVILFVVVDGITLRAIEEATAEPPPEERAGLPPNGLSVSCSKGEEDRGYFNGVGDNTTPSFEENRDGWRYSYASAGSGAFSIEALDEDGNPLPSSNMSGVAGDAGRSPRIEAQGIFSLKIDADDEVGHTVVVCDEMNPDVSNKGDLTT